jgi:pimeloyl-ACP methyl ester carboxylesterase
MIVQERNKVINRPQDRPIVYDIFLNPNIKKAPLIIFCHGYKGFKDWGAWNLWAEAFAVSGIAFLKFNFSHNGGTVSQPVDFPDLEAFAQNNYSKELDDLSCVIDWVHKTHQTNSVIDVETIFLIGHSRGGGIVTIKASEDDRIKKVITLAGVSDYKSRFPKGDALVQWQKEGVYHVENKRTRQQMPHYIQFYLDFLAHEERLTIENAAQICTIPHLIIHGDADKAVSIAEAQRLHSWSSSSIFKCIEGGDHVFGAKHPWEASKMPPDLVVVFSEIVHFINN